MGMSRLVERVPGRYDCDMKAGPVNAPKRIRVRQVTDLNARRGGPGVMAGVFAHPDDESLLIGGAFAAAKAAGWHTLLVTASNGELGGKHMGTYGSELAKTRSRELKEAARRLSIDELVEVGLPDQGVDVGSQRLTRVIAELYMKHDPDIIVTHDPFDSTQHKDHVATARAVMRAIKRREPTCQGRLFFAALKPDKVRPTYILDVGRFSDIKIQALRAHVSQGIEKYLRIPTQFYYALNHFEYFIPYETKEERRNQRHYTDQK